jgi:sulfur carrier protein ThiS
MATKKKVAKKAVKASSDSNIEVRLASLAKPIEVKKIKKGTSLAQFLSDNGLSYNPSVRVNTSTVDAEYKLKKGDIICIVTQVSGGSR